MAIHGGDIYGNSVTDDFSVNGNPMGIPPSVVAALHRAASRCECYPDIEARALKRAVSGMLAVPKEYLLFGNGASELFMAVVHGLKPRKTVIPVPSFYGYEHAAKAEESEIHYYELKRENGFCVTEKLSEALTEDVELLFLANPNNPTGRLIEKKTLTALLHHCEEKGIYVVLDECFVEFCGECHSMISETENFAHLIVVRAFTKIFSIPGVRLGYLVCKNKSLVEKIAAHLPEWNLSCFAQEAGCACTKETAFIMETEKYVRQERAFLERELERKGFLVFPSSTDFILVYREEPSHENTLYSRLLERGILIRDCENFRGLGRGFYRIAVKSREENRKLLRALGEGENVHEGHRICVAGRD